MHYLTWTSSARQRQVPCNAKLGRTLCRCGVFFICVKALMTSVADCDKFKQELGANVFVRDMMNLSRGAIGASLAYAAGSLEDLAPEPYPGVRLQVRVIVGKECTPAKPVFDDRGRLSTPPTPFLTQRVVEGNRLGSP